MSTLNPLFIVGVGRSGTTLLSFILDNHSRIAIPHESHFFLSYFKNLPLFGDLSQNVNRERLVRSILGEFHLSLWEPRVEFGDINLANCTSLSATIAEIYQVYARKRNKDIWGDKTPAYTAHIHVLHRLFPEARYIHLIRDGRDVARSIVRQYWGPNNFIEALRYWKETVSAACKMLDMLPHHQVLELRFEDFVVAPKRHLQQIMDFMGLEYEDQMLSAQLENSQARLRTLGDRKIRSDHVKLAMAPLSSEAFKWKHHLSGADQAIAWEIAGEVLSELGYEPGRTRHPLRILRKGYHRLYECCCWRLARLRNALHLSRRKDGE